MDQEDLLIQTEGRVRVLCMNRPARRNALSHGLMGSLVQALQQADRDEGIGAVVLTGEGSSFCSGADLRDMSERDREGVENTSPYLRQDPTPFEVVAAMNKPVLAAINGPAVAAGMELALSCDIRIAQKSAWFCLPEAKRGLAAQFASVVLPRVVGSSVAAEWLFTGRMITMDEAVAARFVSRVTEDGQSRAAALEIAAGIASNAPLSLRRMKRLVRETWDMPLAKALRHQPGPDPYTSDDRREGVRAFIEKREPVWKGK